MKRWYQLSVLQMLVLAAAITVLCSMNSRMRRSEIEEYYSFGSTELAYKVELLSAGWPFTCYVRTGTPDLALPQGSAPKYIDTVYWGALFKNLVICVVISGVVTATSEFFWQRAHGLMATSRRTQDTT